MATTPKDPIQSDAFAKHWRVNYTWVSPNGQLRAGAVIVLADKIEAAKETASKMLITNGQSVFRITKIVEY